MDKVKEILVRTIPSSIANEFVKKYHYSKSFVQNSVLHFGCFLDGKLHGVLQYGNSIDKRNTIGFVDSGLSQNEAWNTFLELNRLAFDDYLPKNSESRCIAISIRLIKKYAPQIKWLLSYADGTQCGDGTIYRAAGFHLCGINRNSTIYKLADGRTKAKHGTSKANFSGAKKLEGYQLRYIYLIDKSCKITVPILPFSAIDKAGAGMYKGEKKSRGNSLTGKASVVQTGEGVRFDLAAQKNPDEIQSGDSILPTCIAPSEENTHNAIEDQHRFN